MVLLQLDHLDKVAVPHINRICVSLNAASQDVSSGDKMEEDKNEAYLEKDFKTHLTAVPNGKLCDNWVSRRCKPLD